MGSFDPFLFFSAAMVTGSIAAFFAHKRGRNPYLFFAVGFAFGLLGTFFLFLPSAKKKEPEPVAPLLPTISGPIDKFWYYVDPNHQQQGPLSHEALTNAFRQKKIGEATYVWNEELTEWKPLGELVEIQ